MHMISFIYLFFNQDYKTKEENTLKKLTHILPALQEKGFTKILKVN